MLSNFNSHRPKSIWINAPTPPFNDHFKLINELDPNKLNALIYGYIRLLVENVYAITIPNEMKLIILLFYHVKNSICREDIFGATYLCQHKQTGKQYAVKILNKSIFYRIYRIYRPRYLRAMHDEIEILSTLKHPNIIQLHNVYEDEISIHIVMEQCKGGQLFERIAEKGFFTEQCAAKIVKQLLSALRYMHEENDIVHCNLKPENILFTNKSENAAVKIIDFGMSKVWPRIRHSRQLCDTGFYTAPEVIKKKKYTHGCDLWSIGIILYIMLFGYPPFYVDPAKYGNHERKCLYNKIKRGFIARIRSTEKHGFGPWFPDHIIVSQEVRDLISKLLEFKPRTRYTAAEALQHPWITNLGKCNNSKEHPQFIESLVKFNNTCQFKSTIAQLFRQQLHNMKPVHFHELEQLFIEMDTDNDGIISDKQFYNVLSNTSHICIDKQFIKNEYGIKYSDLLNALVYDYIVACDQHLYTLFRRLDDDNDSKIQIKQLKEKLKEYDPFNEYNRAMEIVYQIIGNVNDDLMDIDYELFLLNLHPNFEDTPDWIPDVLKNMKALTPAKTKC